MRACRSRTASRRSSWPLRSRKLIRQRRAERAPRTDDGRRHDPSRRSHDEQSPAQRAHAALDQARDCERRADGVQVERRKDQPPAERAGAAAPGTNGQPADTNVSTSDVNKIRSCALIHRKWISVRRLIGAGNRNAISASLNASAARFSATANRARRAPSMRPQRPPQHSAVARPGTVARAGR